MIEVYKNINKEVVGIQELLYERSNYHDEIEEYLISCGYEKKVYVGYDYQEVLYIKDYYVVEIVNDIEVLFTHKNQTLCIIERDGDKITVRFDW